MSRVHSFVVVLLCAIVGASRIVAQDLSFTPNHLFVTDFGNGRVVELDRAGESVGSFGAGELIDPEGISFGPDGLAYVASSGADEVVVFDAAGVVVRRIQHASLDQPVAIAFGSRGHVFVSSSLNHRVVEFDADGGYVGEITHADLAFPAQIRFNAGGHLLCAGAGSLAVFEFDPGGALVRKVGDGTFANPIGLALGPTGKLRVSDGISDVVRIFDSTGDLGASTSGASIDGPSHVVGGPNYANYVACIDSDRVVQFLGSVATRELGSTAGLSGPGGLAFAPFRIKVYLEGKISGGANLSGFKQRAMLSLAPGSNQIMLEFLPHVSGVNYYASVFGAKYAVLHGLEGVTGPYQLDRLFRGREIVPPSLEHDGSSISIRAKGKVVGDESYFVPKKISGTFDAAVGYHQLQARISTSK